MEPSADEIIRVCDNYLKASDPDYSKTEPIIKERAIDCIRIFDQWFLEDKQSGFYKDLKKDFSPEYLENLYQSFIDMFTNEEIITDSILEKFKKIVMDLFLDHKKYGGYYDKLSLNPESDYYLVLRVNKHIFECIVGKVRICFFKSNGNDFYLV